MANSNGATGHVRLKDIAQTAGVAVSTVSRALSDPNRVNFQTAEHIKEVAQELGYRRKPAESNQSNAIRHHRDVEGGMIALVVEDTVDGISSQILKGAQTTALESDNAVSLIETGTSPRHTMTVLNHIADKIDGVILATNVLNTEFIRSYTKHTPLVMLNRPVDGVPSIVPDPRIGVVRALDMLRRLHHTSLTYVSGPNMSWSNHSRWSTLHAIAIKMGFKINRIGPVRATVEGGFQAAIAMEGNRPTAVVTYNDLIAAGIVLKLMADGIKVPEDISVIGFDNTLIAPVVTPPITSIRIPRSQIGQVAVQQLLGKDPQPFRSPSDVRLLRHLEDLGITDEQCSSNVTLVDTSIVVRRSVGERRREDSSRNI